MWSGDERLPRDMDGRRLALIRIVTVQKHPSAARAYMFGCFNNPAVNLKRAEGGIRDAVRQMRVAETTHVSAHS